MSQMRQKDPSFRYSQPVSMALSGGRGFDPGNCFVEIGH